MKAMQFAEWAEQSLAHSRAAHGSHRFGALDAAIDKKRVTAFGEFAHGMAELLNFRNELFQRLVQRHGYRAIALETGRDEAECLDAYVRGENDDLDAALSSGFTWSFGTLPQNRDLLAWIRAFNDRFRTDAISIFGFDVSADPPDFLQGSAGLAEQLRNRDAVQARNILALSAAAPERGMLIFGHWGHLSTIPFSLRFSAEGDEVELIPAGVELRRLLGDSLLNIGSLAGSGTYGCVSPRKLAAAERNSIAHAAHEVTETEYLLDLTEAPHEVAEWLAREHLFRDGDFSFRIRVRPAFDLLFYADSVTPACDGGGLQHV